MEKDTSGNEKRRIISLAHIPSDDCAFVVGNIGPESAIRLKNVNQQVVKFFIDNTGVTALHFYVSDEQADKISEAEIILRPGEKTTFLCGRDGQPGKVYLVCYNPDPSENGQYFVNELIND